MSDLLSPDGHYRWSGSAWVPVAPLLSPDGNYWWSGTEWVPITTWPNSPAAATTFYGAPPILTEGGTEGFAIVSLVLGLLFFLGVTAIGAVIFGHVALQRIKRTARNGRGTAIAGVCLGYVGIALLVLAIVLPVVLSAKSDDVAGSTSSSAATTDDEVSWDLMEVSEAEQLYSADNIGFTSDPVALFADADVAPSGDNDLFLAVSGAGYCVVGNNPEAPARWFVLDSTRGLNGGNNVDPVDGPYFSQRQAESQCTGTPSPHFTLILGPDSGNVT